MGAAGARVVIEEFLAGEEASFIVMADGEARARRSPPARTTSGCCDGDRGPNTGGMGAYSPAPVVTPEVHARVMREVILPDARGMETRGHALHRLPLRRPDDRRARASREVLEFNCRLGDPETQPIMMRLKSDLLDLVEHAIDGTLDRAEAEWDRRAALGVVLAAAGYPDTPRKGDEIAGCRRDVDDCHVFHAGTALNGRQGRDRGGRVLCVTALGDNVKIAAERAYEVAAGIRFDGMQYRRDIGHRAIHRQQLGAAMDIDAVRTYLTGLQDRIVGEVQPSSTASPSCATLGPRPRAAAASSRLVEEGSLLERGGVGFSHVHGREAAALGLRAPPGDSPAGRWEAMGVSLVFHPRNPYVPTVHMNVRFFAAKSPDGDAAKAVWWFGGGMDLTPYYGFEEDCAPLPPRQPRRAGARSAPD